MSTPSLDLAESKFLLSLCRTGKLYEIERWIAAGQSTKISSEISDTPLNIALEFGFHSLVELLLKNESTSEMKNSALARAVSLRRLDLVELCLEHGADLHSVPLADVLLEWNPKVIGLFIDRGADVITGTPFAIAFREKIRTAIGPFLRCKEKYPELKSQLEEQANCALRYFCSEGNSKWVSLMAWLGADPRARGSSMSYWEEDPESYSTALEEACSKGVLDVVKKLKIDPQIDNLSELLLAATLRPGNDVISYLLLLGANPNDRVNGGSSALTRCLWHIRFENIRAQLNGWRTAKWSLRKTFSSIEMLASKGARWVPEDKGEISSIRRELLRCDADVTVEVLSIFTRYGTSSQETLEQLLKTPSMKQHVKEYAGRIARLGLTKIFPPVGALTIRPSRGDTRTYPRYVSPSLLGRYSRDKLYEEVWSQPIRTLAKSYGVSDVALLKTCRKLAVPLPGRGYWSKKAAGKVSSKPPPLPELKRLT